MAGTATIEKLRRLAGAPGTAAEGAAASAAIARMTREPPIKRTEPPPIGNPGPHLMMFRAHEIARMPQTRPEAEPATAAERVVAHLKRKGQSHLSATRFLRENSLRHRADVIEDALLRSLMWAHLVEIGRG
jgi:hypothetical protein